MSRSAEKAYLHIRDAIVNADYLPGSHLKEEDLSAAIGLSRTPIREALRRLATEGLVAFARNQGTFVERFTADDIDEIFQLRATLEAHSAARAATRIGEAEIAELKRLTGEMEALQGRPIDDAYVHEFNRLNAEFHRLILSVAQSRRLEAMLETIIDIPLILMKHFNWQAIVDLERSCLQYRELISAFENRDPDWASSLMRAHILGARGDRRRFPMHEIEPAEAAE